MLVPIEGWIALGCTGLVAVAASGAAWLALFPFVPRDLGGAPDLDARARRFKIPVTGSDAIDAWFVAGTRRAVVLVLHGYGREHTRAWRYAEFLHRAGYGVLTVDFRSSRRRESGKRLPTTLGHHELPDARAALGWLLAQPELRGHAIALLGESLGGAVALMLAAETPCIEALVVDGAFASGRHAIEDSSERWARVPRWPTALLARAVGRVFTGHDPGTPDAIAAAQRLSDRPIYFIHGLDDNRISPRQVRMLWEAAGAKDPLWVVHHAGHNEPWIRHPREYERRVLEFFETHLAVRESSRAHALSAAGNGHPAAALQPSATLARPASAAPPVS